jgi:glycosyltransferase involved in cell wall biosynthesis
MREKLLSIAIPTWNRAEIIEISLSRLLLQIDFCYVDVQLIISDNASNDNTLEIVHNLLKAYPKIDSVVFSQTENTGYYGNFKKCRELASGKYFWLLSDNEVILNGMVEYIVNKLKQSAGAGIFYLNNIPNQPVIIHRVLSFDQLFYEQNYKLTLISACIILNIKEHDKLIFNEFSGNSFLGYALLLNTRKYSEIAQEISGEIYQSIPAVVSFNVFKSWTIDIFQCFDYIEKENLFSGSAVEYMKECILKYVMKDHVLHYRMHNSYYGRNLGPFEENYSLLFDYYGDVKNFNDIKVIKNTGRPRLFFNHYIRKFENKIRKTMKRF